MAGNGIGKDGGKHSKKQVLGGNGASSTAPPTFRFFGFVYSWSAL
jgi:hypothetical protein